MDSRWSHDAFARSLGLGYPLLSDLHREVIRSYGLLWGEEGVSQRALLVVDKKGVLRFRLVFEVGQVPTHEEALRVLQSLAG